MWLEEVEFSVHSQNGEDGIIQFLMGVTERPEGVDFLEIGASNGDENNTTYLALQGYKGFAVEQNPRRIQAFTPLARERGVVNNIHLLHLSVTPALVVDIMYQYPDIRDCWVFSLDIDSYDWHICHAMVNHGFRPVIMVLEVNPSFVSDPVTIPLFHPIPKDKHLIYYGCGYAAWRALLEPLGYKYLGVDTNGVNAFFVDESRLKAGTQIDVLHWTDNPTYQRKIGLDSRRAIISYLPLETVG